MVCLLGPTGIGKSALAMALAERLPAEIVSVDSAMIYRGMDIGTAKPGAEERKRVPHHLIDIRDPGEPYSAAEFARDAEATIRTIIGRGRCPILCGGTFLYFRALIEGLSPMPSADAEVRAGIRARAEREGWDALHRELVTLDAEAAARIHPNDHQRLERALELCHASGTSPSALHATQSGGADFRFLQFALWPDDRAALASRLEARFHAMLDAGLVAEVRTLHAREDLSPELPAMRAVGYRQMLEWLRGECDYDEAVRRAVVATRRYAKRQLTWLRCKPDCTPIRVAVSRPEPFASQTLEQVYESLMR